MEASQFRNNSHAAASALLETSDVAGTRDHLPCLPRPDLRNDNQEVR
jgi:hypothetical protein